MSNEEQSCQEAPDKEAAGLPLEAVRGEVADFLRTHERRRRLHR